MKCIVTGKETNQKTKNFPLSTEGRLLVPQILNRHNERIAEVFMNKHKTDDMTPAQLKILSIQKPRISTKYALSLLAKKEADMMETLEEVLSKTGQSEQE